MAILKKLTVIASAALISGSAFAADATFENHLQSATIVSPAQLYQVRDSKTDFSLGYASKEESTKLSGTKATTDTTGTELFAAGIYNLRAIGLRAGLAVDYVTGTQEDKSPDLKTTGDATAMVVTPQAAYPIGPVVLGAAFDITQETLKNEDAEEQKVSYTTFRPGVLFQNSDFEAGLTYTSPHNTPAETATDLEAISPAVVQLHGRVALDRNFAVGAIVANNHYSPLDKFEGKQTLKDQTTLKATSEYTAGVIKFDGDLGYNGAYYNDTDFINYKNISTMEVGAGADYAVNKDASVGGALNYEFGSEKSKGTTYAVNDLGFAIRGNIKF